MLAEYEKALPGLAKQIVERADKEQKHRHDTTAYQIETQRIALNHNAR